MYMRFVRLIVKEGRLNDFRKFYETRVIHALQETKGCLFASLLQPSGEDHECVSLTLWSSQKRAEEYEHSGLYDQLLDDSDEFLAEAAEWRAQLAGDPGGDFPRLQEPDVEAFPVEIVAESGEIDDTDLPHLFLRIVAVRVDPGRFGELREAYNSEVVPALLETPGCVAVFLVEGMSVHSRALSVTVWDSEEKAVRYEMSGAFDRLASKLSEYFSGLYQWKLSLVPSAERDEVTGQDLDVSGYRIVTGRRLVD
jgi:heme-degrading monooxygenase HmoA